MSDLRIYIPKALAFQRVAKTAVAAANQVDHGAEINEAHAFALLEFFEFLAPEQITPLMGPGLGAELSAIIESEFDWDSLGDRTSSKPPLHPCLGVRRAVLLRRSRQTKVLSQVAPISKAKCCWFFLRPSSIPDG